MGQGLSGAEARLKLYYFDMAGKGEPIRLLAAYAGLPLEDHRFKDRDEFAALKASGKLRFGQVPALEVTPGGDDPEDEAFVLTQSLSILRYLSKCASASLELYPADPALAAVVDAVGEQEADAFAGVRCCKYAARFGMGTALAMPGALEAARKDNLTETVPRHLGLLEAQLAAGGTGWLAGTKQPSLADFLWAPQLKGLPKWLEDENCLDAFPKLRHFVEEFYTLPAIQKYYGTRKSF